MTAVLEAVRSGNERLSANRPDQALEAFVKALDTDPGHVPAIVGFVRAALALGKNEAADEAAGRAMQLAPEDRDVLIFSGVAAEASGRIPQALERYAKAADKDPASYLALFNLGRALGQVRRYDEAAERLRRACELAPPGRHEPWYNLAIAHQEQGRTGDAIDAMTRALEANPAFVEGYLALADLLCVAQRLDVAERVLEQAGALFPGAGSVHDKLAAVAVRKGDLRRALTHLESQVLAEPENRIAYLNLSTFSQLAGDLERAEGAIQRLLERDPRSHEGRYHLGCIYEAAGLAEKAKAELRIAAGLAPAWWRPKNNLAHILMSESDRASQEEAASLLAEAVRLAPVEEPGPRYNLALVSLALGDARRAAQLATETLQKAPAGHEIVPAAQDLLKAAQEQQGKA